MHPGDRLLIPITYGFSARYLLPTGLLERLSTVCRPVVGLGWRDPELEERVERLGVEVVALPTAELTEAYRAHRRRMAVLHERRLASPTSWIRRQRDLQTYPPLGRTISRARRATDEARLSIPGRAGALERHDEAAIRSGTNVSAFDSFLGAIGADAVMSLTPYHDQDGLLSWAATRARVPVIASFISFDNPTTRSRSLAVGDVVSVWNRHMAEQLVRTYPDLNPEAVHVVGAPQFDLHHRADLVMARSEWLEAVGAPLDRPVVLYGASPAHLVPDEQFLVRALDESISSGRVAGDPFLVVRRHPVDPSQVWQGLALRHGIVTEPWAPTGVPMRSWPDDEELRLQMSALAHSDAHVNICSSMTLDGSMFDRPQIGPGCVPGASRVLSRQIRSMYKQEHWWPIERSGALDRVGDLVALERALSTALEAPSARSQQRRSMLEEVLTFPDGGAVERLVQVVGRD